MANAENLDLYHPSSDPVSVVLRRHAADLRQAKETTAVFRKVSPWMEAEIKRELDAIAETLPPAR
jgi:hypothetical protein